MILSAFGVRRKADLVSYFCNEINMYRSQFCSRKRMFLFFQHFLTRRLLYNIFTLFARLQIHKKRPYKKMKFASSADFLYFDQNHFFRADFDEKLSKIFSEFHALFIPDPQTEMLGNVRTLPQPFPTSYCSVGC